MAEGAEEQGPKQGPILFLQFIVRNHTGTPRCVHQLGTRFPSCRVQAPRVTVGSGWWEATHPRSPPLQGMMYKSGGIQSPSPPSPRRMRC